MSVVIATVYVASQQIVFYVVTISIHSPLIESTQLYSDETTGQ